MNLVYSLNLLLLPLLLPGVDPVKIGDMDLNDPLTFVKFIGKLFHGGDVDKKARFEEFLSGATDLVLSEVLDLSFVVELKDKFNKQYRPGSLPKEITPADILQQIKLESIQTRNHIRSLEYTIKMKDFKDIEENTEILEGYIASLHNASYETLGYMDSIALKWLNDSLDNIDLSPMEMAKKLKAAVTKADKSNNFMQLAIDTDEKCMKQTLLNAQEWVLNLLNRLNYVDSVRAIYKGNESRVNDEGIEPIRTILRETQEASQSFIDNFNNVCWTTDRVKSLINGAVTNDRKKNETARAEGVMRSLAKWHTRDIFLVVARTASECAKECSFQESYNPANYKTWEHVITSDNVTVVRIIKKAEQSWKDIDRISEKLTQQLKERKGFLCKDDANFVIERIRRFAYVVVNDERCPTAILATEPNAFVTRPLGARSKGESLEAIGAIVPNWVATALGTKVQYNYTMVVNCEQVVESANGKVHEFCNF